MRAYFLANSDKAEDFTRYGIKMSDVSCGAVTIYGQDVNFYRAYLCPGDIPTRAGTILKLELDPTRTFIAEEALSGENFTKSIVKCSDYRLGMYRKPVCIVVYSVFEDAVSGYNDARDEAILYESSEALYFERLFAVVDDKDADFRREALRMYFEAKAGRGECVRNEDEQAVWFAGEDGTIMANFRKESN